MMRRKLWKSLLVLAIASMLLVIFGSSVVPAVPSVVAATPTLDSLATSTQSLQISVDTVWVLITGFLVFFMQTGFALLEAGLVRQISVVNTLLENFIDAGVTALVWWATGFAIAFGSSAGGIVGTNNFFLSDAIGFSNGTITYSMGAAGSNVGVSTLALFFFQFAFAATASTITTGAMAERTDFVGYLIYAAIMGGLLYPLIVHWVWNSEGWLNKLGYMDFAGSSVVHTFGGWTALVGAYLLGARVNRVWGEIPAPHNLSLATLGTMILWFGWFGFNPGSTLGTSNHGLIGLVTVNTALAGSAGSVVALLYVFFRTGKWNLFCALNGSLAGLVGVTAGCAFIAPWGAVLIGIVAGILVIVVVDFIESLEIDDPVGAFAVHGSCGMMGTIAVGFLGLPELTVNKKAG
jgi:ammonium transporter, Amt family